VSKRDRSICYVNPGINLRRPISFLMKFFKKNGYKISILTPIRKTKLLRERTRHFDNFKGTKLLTYPVRTRSSGFYWPVPISLDFLKKSWQVLKQNDIIHVWVPFYPNTFIICFLKLLFFKRKTLFLTMDTFPAYSFQTSSTLDVFFKIFFKTFGKIAFLASNKILIYGKSFLEYAKLAGVSSKKVLVTPTGIDLIPKAQDKNIREIFNISEREKIILFVGLHNRRKGIDLIIKTAELLKKEHVRFVLVGDGPERESFMNLSKQLGLNDRILFVGNRLDVHNFYKQADIFFLPSRGEGLAGVLMEAMLYQVPIITSNIAGTRDLITHMDNGILCKTEDYYCYAKAIKKLLSDNILQTKFKKCGLITIKSKFLWDNNIKRFQSIYRSQLLKR
jgi:glycosyltransferase involved in cell wall biosynthesis